MVLTRVLTAVRTVMHHGRLLAARSRRRAILVSGSPEDALLASAIALRRLGARITRYDVEDGALEARWSSSRRWARVRVQAGADDTTDLDIESGGVDSRSVIRRFRAELGRPAARERS